MEKKVEKEKEKTRKRDKDNYDFEVGAPLAADEKDEGKVNGE